MSVNPSINAAAIAAFKALERKEREVGSSIIYGLSPENPALREKILAAYADKCEARALYKEARDEV